MAPPENVPGDRASAFRRSAPRPASVQVAAALLVLEGVAGGAAALWTVVSTVRAGGYLPSALMLAVIFAFLGVTVGLAGRAVGRGDRWGRSVGVTWQVFLVLGAWSLLQSGLVVAAVPVAVVAGGAVWSLVAPATTAHLFPSDAEDGDGSTGAGGETDAGSRPS